MTTRDPPARQQRLDRSGAARARPPRCRDTLVLRARSALRHLPRHAGCALRLLLRERASAADARTSLASVAGHPRHTFWPDELDYHAARLDGVVGHRQVTDAYLAAQARSRSGTLATFDRGLAALHSDVAVIVPH